MRFGLVGIGKKTAGEGYKTRRKLEAAIAVISTTIHVTFFSPTLTVMLQIGEGIMERQPSEDFLP
jgi:hypothetical protein